jgi:hypothetical protein
MMALTITKEPVFEQTSLPRVWESLLGLPTLGSIAQIHRGIEFTIPFEQHKASLVSESPRTGFVPGLIRLDKSVEPYLITNHQYVTADRQLMLSDSLLLPWHQPKVFVNADSMHQHGWSVVACIDTHGLYSTQHFYCVWPRADLPVEALAALLNSPVANAYVNSRRGNARENRVSILVDIPVPIFTPSQITLLCLYVHEYQQHRQQWLKNPGDSPQYVLACRQTQNNIDAVVLKAYDLPARLERELLDMFAGHKRPGPVPFDRYYPADFEAAIPWAIYISDEFQNSSATQTLLRLPVFHDPVIHEAVNFITEDD